MKFIELFAGIGGFRYGLEQASGEFEHVWSNEFDKYSASIYRNRFGEIDERDITTISTEEIPEHDLLTAGFPCQAFSIAGNRLGFEDTRGTLFFEVARILRDKRPRYFLLENVKGLLGHKSGKTFQTILGVLTDLGYVCEWEVLNSKHFGVPQNRERVFIVGHLGGGSGRKVFPLTREGERDGEKVVSNTIDRNYWKGIDNHGQRTMIQVGNVDQRGHNSLWGRVYDPKGLSATINSHGGGLGAKTGLYLIEEGWEKENRIRRLTPKETERLQGFPDDWTKEGIEEGEVQEISDTRRYMATGNAVTTKVIRAIGKKLLTVQ